MKNGIDPQHTKRDRPAPFDKRMSIEDKIATILLSKRFEDYQSDIRRARVYLLMDLFFRGYQNLGPWNESLMAWPSYDADPVDYMENRFRRNILINAGGLIRMEPAPIIRPAGSSFVDFEASMAAQDGWEKAKEEIAYDQLVADKSLHKPLFGNTFIYSGYQTNRRFGTVLVPKITYDDVEIPGSAICPDCAMTAPEGTPQCPQCGMPMQQYGAMATQEPRINGYDERERGQLFSTAFTPLEIKVRSKVKGGLANAPYLIRNWREDIELLEYAFPNLDTSNVTTQNDGNSDTSGSDVMLRYQALLSSLPPNVSGNAAPYWTTTAQFPQQDVVMGWLTPQTYRGDKELEKAAPDGLMAVWTMGQIVEWKPERLTDVWTHELYYPNAHNFYGDGMVDDVPIQRAINQVGQLQVRHLEYDTIPMRLYDDSLIQTGAITNDPSQKWIAVATTLERGLGDAVKDLPAQTLSWDVNALKAGLYQADQDISAATDPVSGKIAGANTPYSAQILAVEQGQTRFLPTSRYNKDAVKDHVRQVLRLAEKNWTDARTLAEIDQNTGKYSWKMFTGADLSRGSWTVYVMDSDFKPRTRGEQIQALETARNFGVDVLGSPKMRLQFFEKIGLTPDGDTLSTQARRASRQIERIRAGEMVTPIPMIDDDMTQVAVFTEYLASQQGDQLKEENEQAWQAAYQYMQAVLQMVAMKQQAMGVMGIAPMGGPSGAPQGEPGHGPKPPKQENAQSPVPSGAQQPMPPVPGRQEQASGA